ncbi:MAG: PaaI family thioesterase [Verrucomicrobiota bacterium]
MVTFDEELVKARLNAFPFVRMMGMRLLSCRDGKSVMRCRVRQALRNSGGTLHGGVIGALVDMSVATALRSVLPVTSRMTTVEYKVNLLKPVSDGSITAHGTVLRVGRTIAVGSTEIRNAAGEPVAFGSATFYLLNLRAPGDAPGIMVATKGGGKIVPGPRGGKRTRKETS